MLKPIDDFFMSMTFSLWTGVSGTSRSMIKKEFLSSSNILVFLLANTLTFTKSFQVQTIKDACKRTQTFECGDAYNQQVRT